MFKLGDRVITTGQISTCISKGAIGTIIDEGKDVVSVEFDEEIKNGHTCGGLCEFGYGWNVLVKYLKPFEYKVGDTVLIKSWEEMEEEFGLDCDGDIDSRPFFMREMRKYCGSLLNITHIYKAYDGSTRYELDDIGDYSFSGLMFDKVESFTDELLIDDGFDPVSKPKHYADKDIEVIDYIKDTLTPEGYEGYCVGNILKYVSRYRNKNGVEDLEKAQYYLNEVVKLLNDVKEGK